MIMLLIAVVILAGFLLIVSIKSISRTSNGPLQKADASAKNEAEDPEFAEKDKHLELFLEAQELLVSMGEVKISFKDEREKLRYTHFVFGAVDALSRTIGDEKRAQEWWEITCSVRGILLLGIKDGVTEYARYGHTDDVELMDAGKRGYFAMGTYIHNAVGKCSREEFQQSCTELFAVVNGKS